MNVLFPMNGLGSRFSSEGYVEPKAIIKAGGEALIIRVLESFDFDEGDNIYISYHRELKKYNFEHLVLSRCPRKIRDNINFYCFPHDTEGAAHTLIESIKYFGLTGDDLLVADCDVIYNEPVLSKFTGFKSSAIGYSIDDNPNPIYSYIKTEGVNKVSDIAEKIKISDKACCGLYFFCDYDVDRLAFWEPLDSLKDFKEIYISHLYNWLLDDGRDIFAVEFENFNCVGTPIQMQSVFNEDSSVSEFRVCFDLDNTLVTYPEIHGDYTTVKPIAKNINYLRQLKKHGAYIIIYTARRMRTHSGNVSKLIADIGKITLDTLEKFEIPYDEICFGKPYAHFYVDDLAINAYHDLPKAMGFYFNRIDSRSKHKMIYEDGRCIKQGDVSNEAFWYVNAPPKIIESYFPHVLSVSVNKIVMEQIKDVPVSHLYVSDNLKQEQFATIFEALNDIHSYKLRYEDGINYRESYGPKLLRRMKDPLYGENELALNHAKDCLEAFQDIEIDKDRIRLIHGDPVFTNTFLSFDGRVKFIDVRGAVGHNQTIYGDVLYDFAKVYQSVIGYDFVLFDIPVDKEIVRKNKILFESLFYYANFTKEQFKLVQLITKSLLVSMLPLHDKKRHNKFLQLIDNI